MGWGSLGQAATDSATGGAIAGPVGGLVGGASGVDLGNPQSWGRGLQGMTNKAVPKSNFQAQTPGILNQQDFAQALAQAQGNQNMFFQPGANGQNFAQALMGNYNQAQGQQQQLINSLQQQAQGQGPGSDLAQNMLHQATDQNNMQQAGLIASQKGISPALAARMAGQNAAQANQQAAAQATGFGLQQQLAAQNQLGSALAQNQAMQANQLQGIGSLANQQYSTLQGANTAQNQLGVQSSLGAQGLNQATQGQNAGYKAQLEGGLLNGAGGLGAAAIAAAQGGEIAGNAPHEGDDSRNDTVPAMLSPGEVVVPRSVVDDREKTMRFLEALKGSDWNKKRKAK